MRTTLASLGFAPSTAEPSLFLRTDTTLPPFYVLVYVDDLVFASVDTEALAHVKSELKKRHTCTDVGEMTSYIGLRITRDRAQRTITLTQSHMVQQVLQRFGFTYSSPQSTPLPTGHSLSAPPSDESVEPSGPYPELVGCLMYLMTCTRSDLAYPLSIRARYVAPGRHRKEHMDAAKRVLRYLCSTSGMGLVLGGRARVVLTGHADASWVDNLATQRTSQGYIFSLGSGSVSWRSTRSSFVLSSSCEGEIYDGAMAAQELRWLTYLLTDLGEAPRSPPVLYVDYKAMLALCQKHRLEHRTKHIALSYFLARELQQRGQLRLAYVATRANTADIFTKALQPLSIEPLSRLVSLQLAFRDDSLSARTPAPARSIQHKEKTGELLSTLKRGQRFFASVSARPSTILAPRSSRPLQYRTLPSLLFRFGSSLRSLRSLRRRLLVAAVLQRLISDRHNTLNVLKTPRIIPRSCLHSSPPPSPPPLPGGGTTRGVVLEDSGKAGEGEGSRVAGAADSAGVVGGGGGSGGKSSGGAERGAAAGGGTEGGVFKVPGRTIRTLCRLHYSGVHMVRCGAMRHMLHVSLRCSLPIALTTGHCSIKVLLSRPIFTYCCTFHCVPPSSPPLHALACLVSRARLPQGTCALPSQPACPRAHVPSLHGVLPQAVTATCHLFPSTCLSVPCTPLCILSSMPAMSQLPASDTYHQVIAYMPVCHALTASNCLNGHPSHPLTHSPLSDVATSPRFSPLFHIAMHAWSISLQRRAFPLLPSPSPSPSASPSSMPAAPALLFSPLILSQPLTASDSHNHSSSFSQLPWPSTSSPTLDSPSVVLHKATDEIVQVDASMDGVHLTFSQPFQHLLDHCSRSSGSLKIIDPLPAVLPLTDRVKTLSLLSDLLATTNDTGNPPASPVLRVPRFVQVPDIRQTAAVLAAMAAVGVRLPVIVKPRIACGAAASHAMAIVFSEDAFATLSLPSPSVIQEYVDHGACQFKCYVLGEAFFAAERRSTPDAAPLLLQQQGQAHGKVGQQQQEEEEEEQRAKVSAAPAAISFDSLKSLPMAFPSQPSEQQQQQQPPLPPLGAVGGFNEAVARRAADLLRSALGLTLFGFDVLVQEGTGEHVVVDVNYFPSFKDVPDHLAIPAFHTACASHLV
ncbi:unnamed protein product [Closterium sp. NIES-54]